MEYAKKNALPVLVLLLVLVVTTIAELNGQNQSGLAINRQEQPEDSYGPIVDSTMSEPVDSSNRARRGRRYNGRFGSTVNSTAVPITPVEDGIEVNSPDAIRVRAMPVMESDVIVVGEIIDAQAYQSPDRTGVYSEFTIRVDSVLKDDRRTPTAPGAAIVAEREGGRLRSPSGSITRFALSGQRMPRVSRRYVLFLKCVSQGEELFILTGYELHEGRVFPVDEFTGNEYRGTDRESFLTTLRNAITQSLQMQRN